MTKDPFVSATQQRTSPKLGTSANDQLRAAYHSDLLASVHVTGLYFVCLLVTMLHSR